MATVQRAPIQDTPKAPLSPARRRWVREGALIMIKSGERVERLPFPADELQQIADERIALLAEGVGPARAAVLLARLRAGDLRAIDGGGERSHGDGQRPILFLVRAL